MGAREDGEHVDYVKKESPYGFGKHARALETGGSVDLKNSSEESV